VVDRSNVDRACNSGRTNGDDLMSKERKAPGSGVVVYKTEDGRNQVLVRLEDENVWLTQAMMAELFQSTPQNITTHIRAIYEDMELSEEATCKQYLQVQTEGRRTVQRRLKHYNLDMIIAVGYRVRSVRGVMFRQWATERLREYLIKGFTLDDERLKGQDRLADYFDELLARIREIRASEFRAYQRIREIFALASDYVENEQETKTFFATMQNKMHFAATGMTAAEIVRKRADAARPNMGLTSWTGSRVFRRDVATAKNYLDEREIDTLNRIVVMFLDQAEFRARRRQEIRMRDWEYYLDKFLHNNELPVLADAGSVKREQALSWAHEQYDAFAKRRRLEAEAEGDTRYLEDLRASAKTVETQRKRPATGKDKKRGSTRQEEP
jgi:hypothetical protein